MLDEEIFVKVETALKSLGSEMWERVQVEGVDNGTCVLVLVWLKPTVTVIVIKQICSLIKLICQLNVAYRQNSYGWEGALSLNDEVVAGTSGGWIGREDDEEIRIYSDKIKKW